MRAPSLLKKEKFEEDLKLKEDGIGENENYGTS